MLRCSATLLTATARAERDVARQPLPTVQTREQMNSKSLRASWHRHDAAFSIVWTDATAMSSTLGVFCVFWWQWWWRAPEDELRGSVSISHVHAWKA